MLGAEGGEMTRGDIWLCMSLSIRVHPPPALPSAVCVEQGCTGGFCHALVPEVWFWVTVSPQYQGYGFG